jgi:hypothetical protein
MTSTTPRTIYADEITHLNVSTDCLLSFPCMHIVDITLSEGTDPIKIDPLSSMECVRLMCIVKGKHTGINLSHFDYLFEDKNQNIAKKINDRHENRFPSLQVRTSSSSTRRT